jgi:hypothetical protein
MTKWCRERSRSERRFNIWQTAAVIGYSRENPSAEDKWKSSPNLTVGTEPSCPGRHRSRGTTPLTSKRRGSGGHAAPARANHAPGQVPFALLAGAETRRERRRVKYQIARGSCIMLKTRHLMRSLSLPAIAAACACIPRRMSYGGDLWQ